MRFKLAEIMAIGALAFSLVGCNSPTSGNANVNANANANMSAANANARAANENANHNANTFTRRAPTREEYERNKESYQKEAKDLGRKIGSGLNDGWLWVKTRYELAATDDLRDSTINVDVEDSVVTLSGTVASPEQKSKAESVVRPIEGVKGVKNLLKASASGTPKSPSANANQKKY